MLDAQLHVARPAVAIPVLFADGARIPERTSTLHHNGHMVDVQTSIDIHCPIKELSQYASDPDNAPTWYENIKSVAWETEPPLSIGSRIAFVAQFLGRRLAYTYEVVEMNEHRFVMKTAQGPFPMETTYEWEEIDTNTTRMRLRNAGQPSGFSRLFAPFMSSMMRKANQKDLQKLKAVLEGR